jgi:hypothetical protein
MYIWSEITNKFAEILKKENNNFCINGMYGSHFGSHEVASSNYLFGPAFAKASFIGLTSRIS